MKTKIQLLLFSFVFLSIQVKALDTLKFARFKDIGIYATSVYNQKYPVVKFLKHRLISPTTNIYDNNQGNATDSVLTPLTYLSLVNDLDMSNIDNDSKINITYLQEQMLTYSNIGVTPISVSLIQNYLFKDSTIALNYFDFQNSMFVDNSPVGYFPFKKDTLFAASPLSQVFTTLQIKFCFNESLHLHNINPTNFYTVDFGDGNGFRSLASEIPYTVTYPTIGVKTIVVKTQIGTRTLISRSRITIQTLPAASPSSCQTLPLPPDTGPISITTNKLGVNVYGKYAIWYSPCNTQKKIRKPFIISVGYNPGKAKQLSPGLIAPTSEIAFELFGQTITIPTNIAWNGEWRGTFYETFNGVYNKRFSPVEYSQCKDSDNGTRMLDRLRYEGYDIIILNNDNGKDFTVNNAALFMELVEQINVQKVANGYYFENVVCGYSAGGIATRLALALMESRYKSGQGPNPHTKLWVNMEGENQGVNVPLGFQHFLGFQKNVGNALPPISLLSGTADLINVMVANFAYNSTFSPTSNELIVYNATAGNGQHPYRTNLLNVFNTVPQNTSNGYPEYCRRVGISQGSTMGVNVPHTNGTLFSSSVGIDLSGTRTSFPSNCGSYTWVGPKCVKKTTARYWSSNNNQNVFDGTVTVDASFTYFPMICISWFGNCVCKGPYMFNLPIQLNQAHVAKPTVTPNFDDTPASTMATHSDVYEYSTYRFYNNSLMGQASAYSDLNLHAFAATTSVLDLHDPNNNYLAGNNFLSPLSLGLMYRAPAEQEPNNRYGFPYITHPTDHYKITPFDAVYGIGANNGTYVNGIPKPFNQIHVQNPQEPIASFLADVEVAPRNLFLSNRNLAQTQSNYTAEFEARDRIIVGKTDVDNKNIYTMYSNTNFLAPNGDFKVTQSSKAIMHAGYSVEFLPGFEVTNGAYLNAYIQPYGNCGISFATNHETDDTYNENYTSNDKQVVTSIENDNNLIQAAKLKMYPNPNYDGMLVVENNGVEETNSTLNIYDLTGKVLLSEVIQNNQIQTINIEKLKTGMYVVEINNKTNKTHSKVIISR